MIRPSLSDALLLVDLQYDFMPSGALGVAGGDEVVPIANRVARAFANVVLTQDWHPRGHVSFASSHPGRKAFETIPLEYGPQVLWPEHCVQQSVGAALHRDLDVPHAQLIVRKGYHAHTDSYSAFMEADRRTHTGLAGYLRERGVTRVFLMGLATDFCVAWSALDARAAGFEAVVIEEGCRAIDVAGSLSTAWRNMEAAGVARTKSGDL